MQGNAMGEEVLAKTWFYLREICAPL